MSWYDAMKDAAQIFGKLKDAESKTALANLKMEGAQLTEDNAKLRLENQELREKLALREEMHWVDNLYWRRRPSQPDEGPYCPACLAGSSNAVRMRTANVRYKGPMYECTVCSHDEPIKAAVDPAGKP